MNGDAARAAMGRDPIAGVGAPERVTVRAIEIPFWDLVGLWFKVASAAIPLALVLWIIAVVVRWIT